MKEFIIKQDGKDYKSEKYCICFANGDVVGADKELNCAYSYPTVDECIACIKDFAKEDGEEFDANTLNGYCIYDCEGEEFLHNPSKKLYKVYANNVNVSKHILEINEKELYNTEEEIIDLLIGRLHQEFEDPDIENKWLDELNSVLVAKLHKNLENNNELECLDYKIVATYDYPTTPNSCGLELEQEIKNISKEVINALSI